MLTPAEYNKMERIAAAMDEFRPIPAIDKQWVIDIHVRERIPVPMQALRVAQRQGFQVAGLVTA